MHISLGELCGKGKIQFFISETCRKNKKKPSKVLKIMFISTMYFDDWNFHSEKTCILIAFSFGHLTLIMKKS